MENDSTADRIPDFYSFSDAIGYWKFARNGGDDLTIEKPRQNGAGNGYAQSSGKMAVSTPPQTDLHTLAYGNWNLSMRYVQKNAYQGTGWVLVLTFRGRNPQSIFQTDYAFVRDEDNRHDRTRPAMSAHLGLVKQILLPLSQRTRLRDLNLTAMRSSALPRLRPKPYRM